MGGGGDGEITEKRRREWSEGGLLELEVLVIMQRDEECKEK